MEYKIQIEKSVLKQLSKIEKTARKKIRTAINNLAGNPRPFRYKKLVNAGGLYRIKINNYRVIYDVRDNVLLVSVLRIAKRNEETY